MKNAPQNEQDLIINSNFEMITIFLTKSYV